jgi:hypothetical protein
MNQTLDSSQKPRRGALDEETLAPPQRLFLLERGWRIGVKSGSDREFCHMMAPGQDFYHRLFDNEVFLARAEERLCLACAARRGLLALEPKRLRDAIGSVPADLEAIPLELDWQKAREMTE